MGVPKNRTGRAVSGNGYVHPEDYGAVGDGTTDDLAAFKAALAAMDPGDTLELGATVYALSGTLRISKAGITLLGAGFDEDASAEYGSVLVARSGFVGTKLVDMSSSQGAVRGVQADADGRAPTALNMSGYGSVLVDSGVKGGTMVTCSVLGNRSWVTRCRIVADSSASGTVSLRCDSTDGMVMQNRIISGRTNAQFTGASMQIHGNHFTSDVDCTTLVEVSGSTVSIVGNVFDTVGDGPQLSFVGSAPLVNTLISDNQFFNGVLPDDTHPAVKFATSGGTNFQIKRCVASNNLFRARWTQKYSSVFDFGSNPASIMGFVATNNLAAFATEFFADGETPQVSRGNLLGEGEFTNSHRVEGIPEVTGSRAGNVALQGLLTALEEAGIIVDSST